MATSTIPTGAAVEMTAADFIPFPNKTITHRGVELSRSTVWRAQKNGTLKTKLFRQPGSTQGRRYILVESLNQWIDSMMVDAVSDTSHLNGKRGQGKSTK